MKYVILLTCAATALGADCKPEMTLTILYQRVAQILTAWAGIKPAAPPAGHAVTDQAVQDLLLALGGNGGKLPE